MSCIISLKALIFFELKSIKMCVWNRKQKNMIMSKTILFARPKANKVLSSFQRSISALIISYLPLTLNETYWYLCLSSCISVDFVQQHHVLMSICLIVIGLCRKLFKLRYAWHVEHSFDFVLYLTWVSLILQVCVVSKSCYKFCRGLC